VCFQGKLAVSNNIDGNVAGPLFTLRCFACVLGPLLETLVEQMRSDLDNNPPLPGSYTPKKGDLCAAKFSDGEWQVPLYNLH